MNVVEYQINENELFFAYIWRLFTSKRYIFSISSALISAMLAFMLNIPVLGWTVLAFAIYSTFASIVQLSRRLEEPIFTSRKKLVFGETGIISVTDRTRTEMTWESLYSWSQSRNFIFFQVDRMGGAFAIPKRAFTGMQLDEFLRLAEKIDDYRNQSSEIQRGEQEALELKDKFVDKVFLSYAREDIDIAMHLFNDLHKAGIDVWLDRKSLLAGQHWKAAIRQAIRESRFFLALLSSNSVSKKGYVQKELKHALEILDEYPESAIFIIPIRLDNCNPIVEKLQELHWIDIFEDWDDGLVRILNTIHSQSTIQRRS